MSSVDVIVPCYKYGHFLEQCVQSVLSQADVAVRVLIIDDESPDQTPQVCERLVEADSRVKAIRHEKNRGHIHTFNEGLEWACADSVLLLSADDYLLPGSLARAARLMQDHPDVGFVFGRCMELAPDMSMTILGTPAHQGYDADGRHVISGSEFHRICGVNNIVPTPTAMVRTSMQKRVGGYRFDLPHTGDFEMWLRLAAHGDVGVVHAVQAVYRRHTNNMSLGYLHRNYIGDLKQRMHALQRFYDYAEARGMDVKGARQKALLDLSHEAVHAASAAFNEGDTARHDEFLAFAREINPQISRSTAWKKLTFKHALGRKGWRAVDAARTGVRRLVAPLKAAG